MSVMKTVGIIIIDNNFLEELSYNTKHKNLINEIISLNYQIIKISLLSTDNINLLYNEIELIFKQCDILLIIGGIRNGIVYKVIEKLFSQELEYNSKLVEILNEINETYDSKEITIPSTVKLLKSNQTYPVISLQRIFILKEEHMERSFEKILKKHLINYCRKPVYSKSLVIPRNGNHLNYLEKLQLLLNNRKSVVKFEFINSNNNNNDQDINLKISSNSHLSLIQFDEDIRQEFSSFSRINSVDCTELWEEILEDNNDLIKLTIKNIHKCFEEFGPENVFVCFNGGKDCTVLLHLILIVFKKFYSKSKTNILCLYIQNVNSFLEQDNFISNCQNYYNLDVITIQNGMKDALKQVLDDFPNYKACFMGTRRIDPYSSNLNIFQMTDLDWPRIMRVSPLLDWHYSDIWDYLLYYKVPYCKLYDLGYTSLGNTTNTIKNPSLLYYDVIEDKEKYLPAYKLMKETKERNGRGNNS